jgi:hypothetical protein
MSARVVLLALFLTAALALSRVLPADTFVFDVTLDTAQQVPPPAGPGTGHGRARVTLDTRTGRVSLSGTYADMASPVFQSHIHGSAPRGVIAPDTFVPIVNTGGTSGTLSLSNALLAPAQVQAMRDGLTYINVHTELNVPGEIRGQIEDGREVKVPAITLPGAVVLVAVLGLAGAGAFAWRRTRTAAAGA